MYACTYMYTSPATWTVPHLSEGDKFKFVQFQFTFEAEKAVSACRARLSAGESPSELLTSSSAEPHTENTREKQGGRNHWGHWRAHDTSVLTFVILRRLVDVDQSCPS